MENNDRKHNRRSIRLKDYDYSQPGGYFITMCTHNHECLFGEIVDGEMKLNEFGEMFRDEWFQSMEIRDEIELFENEFVVMPNHIHGIVWINNIIGATGRSPVQKLPSEQCLTGRSPVKNLTGGMSGQYPTGQLPVRCGRPLGPLKQSLASFVAGFNPLQRKKLIKDAIRRRYLSGNTIIMNI